MTGLLNLLIVYYVAKRASKRTYGTASHRYNDGLERMNRVRESARRARARRQQR